MILNPKGTYILVENVRNILQLFQLRPVNRVDSGYNRALVSLIGRKTRPIGVLRMRSYKPRSRNKGGM